MCIRSLSENLLLLRWQHWEVSSEHDNYLRRLYRDLRICDQQDRQHNLQYMTLSNCSGTYCDDCCRILHTSKDLVPLASCDAFIRYSIAVRSAIAREGQSQEERQEGYEGEEASHCGYLENWQTSWFILLPDVRFSQYQRLSRSMFESSPMKSSLISTLFLSLLLLWWYNLKNTAHFLQVYWFTAINLPISFSLKNKWRIRAIPCFMPCALDTVQYSLPSLQCARVLDKTYLPHCK